jgi:hypothetical protein
MIFLIHVFLFCLYFLMVVLVNFVFSIFLSNGFL